MALPVPLTRAPGAGHSRAPGPGGEGTRESGARARPERGVPRPSSVLGPAPGVARPRRPVSTDVTRTTGPQGPWEAGRSLRRRRRRRGRWRGRGSAGWGLVGFHSSLFPCPWCPRGPLCGALGGNTEVKGRDDLKRAGGTQTSKEHGGDPSQPQEDRQTIRPFSPRFKKSLLIKQKGIEEREEKSLP